jgi:hypothetical protein
MSAVNRESLLAGTLIFHCGGFSFESNERHIIIIWRFYLIVAIEPMMRGLFADTVPLVNNMMN